jgi:hypothetical protein
MAKICTMDITGDLAQAIKVSNSMTRLRKEYWTTIRSPIKGWSITNQFDVNLKKQLESKDE